MYLYIIAYSEDGPCKIGISADPSKRVKNLQTGNPFPLTIYFSKPHRTSKKIENAVHQAFSTKKTGGGDEWFYVSVEEARIVVRATVAALDINLDDSLVLSDSDRQATFRWLGEHDNYESIHIQYDGSQLDDIVKPPDPKLLIANSVSPPSRRSYNPKWCLASESSGGQIDVSYLNTVFKLYPSYHLGQVIEAA